MNQNGQQHRLQQNESLCHNDINHTRAPVFACACAVSILCRCDACILRFCDVHLLLSLWCSTSIIMTSLSIGRSQHSLENAKEDVPSYEAKRKSKGWTIL